MDPDSPPAPNVPEGLILVVTLSPLHLSLGRSHCELVCECVELVNKPWILGCGHPLPLLSSQGKLVSMNVYLMGSHEFLPHESQPGGFLAWDCASRWLNLVAPGLPPCFKAPLVAPYFRSLPTARLLPMTPSSASHCKCFVSSPAPAW